MANIKGSYNPQTNTIDYEPNTPSVKQMRESQANGNTGNGTQPRSYNEVLAEFGQGASINGDDPETPSSSSEDGLPGVF